MTAYDEISARGVSIWLDDLSRAALDPASDVALTRDIAACHVVGVTTNPSIFVKALADGAAYAANIADVLATEETSTTEDVALALMVNDVQQACDILRPVYDATNGLDGRVSIEVDPRLAHDTSATVKQARMLYHLVDRANLLVKIPATNEGLPAITEAISEGISINVTLIFSIDRYRAVMGAYVDGLHAAARNGLDLSRIHSVASLFVSRTDSLIDPQLDELVAKGNPTAAAVRGETGLAIARLCYAAFEETFAQPRVMELTGANVQRPLWASTGVKDKTFAATKYVEGLIAPQTVNTMPRATLAAVGDLTDIPADTVRGNMEHAREVLNTLETIGVDLDAACLQLEAEGITKFEDAWDELLRAVESGIADARGGREQS